MSDRSDFSGVLRAVLAKSAADAIFRAKCLADPSGAVLEATGSPAPAGLRFVEAADGPDAVVLPAFASDPDEITDHDILSQVSGGGAWGYVSIGDRGKACEA